MWPFTKPKLTELVPILQSDDPAVDIIFVHGLNGDAVKTWAMDRSDSWPLWIKNRISSASIWSLSYRLKATNWRGGSMPLPNRAVNVLAAIDSELSQHLPIVFICHSYGGLLVKQCLRTATEIATEYLPLTDRVAGIVFLGTPNSGSSIATYIQALKLVYRSSPAISELERSTPQLQELNYWFRRWFEDNELSLRVYFETQKTYGALIVDESSADLGIANIIPVGVDADHLSICRPAKPDFRVKQTLALVETIIARQPKPRSQSWMQEILSASDSELPRIRAKLKAALARNPNDTKAREALDYLDHLRPPAAALPKVLYYKGGGLLSILIAATMVASLSVFGSEMHLLRSALVLLHALFEFLKKLFE